MAAKKLRSTDELRTEAETYYVSKGWKASVPGSDAESSFCNSLTLRPELCLKRDGMLLLLYVSNSVGDTQHRLFKQVMFDILLEGEHCHVVLAFDKRVASKDEKAIAGLGVGLLQLREQNDPPILIRPPQLSGFRAPLSLDRVPAGLQAHVKELLRRLTEEDTATAVLDLVQVVEQDLGRVVPAAANKPLGGKIKACRDGNLLYPLVLDAADRINKSRIVRAHPATHEERRKDIVKVAQIVVDDALAILFALPP